MLLMIFSLFNYCRSYGMIGTVVIVSSLITFNLYKVLLVNRNF